MKSMGREGERDGARGLQGGGTWARRDNCLPCWDSGGAAAWLEFFFFLQSVWESEWWGVGSTADRSGGRLGIFCRWEKPHESDKRQIIMGTSSLGLIITCGRLDGFSASAGVQPRARRCSKLVHSAVCLIFSCTHTHSVQQHFFFPPSDS